MVSTRLLSLGMFAAVAATTLSATGVSAAGYDAKLNQPSYWGTNCVKIESPENKQFYTATDTDLVKVVVKGGTENAVYTDGNYTKLTAPINPRSGKPYDISHVIICHGAVTPDTPQTPGEVLGDKDKKPTTGRISDTAAATTTPQVLGTSTGKGADMPAEIAATGSNSSLFVLFGLIASAATYIIALRRAL